VRNLKPLRILIPGMLVVMLIVAACGGDDDPTAAPRPASTSAPQATATPAPAATAAGPAPVRGGVLRYWLTRDPSNMDINRQRSSANWGTVIPQMNWLVRNHQGRDGIGPDLATEWTVSGNGTVMTFNLVRNATWSDGEQVNAEDVVWTLNRIINNIDGKVLAPPYKGSLGLVTAIETTDPFTVKLTFSEVSASALPTIGSIGNVIYPEHVSITEFEEKRPVGSGPFQWESYSPGAEVNFVANENYWKTDSSGRPLPYLDGLKMFIIGDAIAGFAAIRTGQVDLTFPWSNAAIRGKEEQLKSEIPGLNVWFGGLGYHYLTFRSGKAPWDDIRVRKAFSLALDRQAFMDVVEEGKGNPLMLLSVPDSKYYPGGDYFKAQPGYNPATKQQDIEEAKRLLAQAGVDPTQIKLDVPIRNIYEPTAVIGTNLLIRALGVDLTVKVIDNATTQETQVKGLFEIYFSRNSGGLDDPSNNLAPFIKSGSGLNYGKWSDANVDAKLTAIDKELDPAKRRQLSIDLEKEVMELHWIIGLGTAPGSIAWGQAVNNLDLLHGQDGPPWQFEDVWLER